MAFNLEDQELLTLAVVAVVLVAVVRQAVDLAVLVL